MTTLATGINNTAVSLSFFRRKKDTTPRRQAFTLDHLTDLFAAHHRRHVKDGAMFSPAQFKPDTMRGNANVESIVLLVADVDKGVDYEALKTRLAPYTYWVWSTHSYTPENGKIRVVILLSRPVPAFDWRDFWQRVQEHIFHGAMDEACKAPSEAYYLPAAVPGASTVTDFYDGRALDPDELPPATSRRHGAEPIPAVLHDGERNQHLLSLTGTLRGRGIETPVVHAILQTVNELLCDPPLDEARIDAIATTSSDWWEPPREPTETCTSRQCDARLAEAMQMVWELNTQITDEDAILANRKLTKAERIAKVVTDRWLERERRAGRLEDVIDKEGEMFSAMARAPKASLARAAGISPKTYYTSLAADVDAGLIKQAVKNVKGPLPGSDEDVPHLTTFMASATGSTGDLRRAHATMERPAQPKKLGADVPKHRAWEGHLNVCATHPFGPTTTQEFLVCEIDGRPLHPVNAGNGIEHSPPIGKNYRLVPDEPHSLPPDGTYPFPNGITDYPPPDEPAEDGDHFFLDVSDAESPPPNGLSTLEREALALFGGHFEQAMPAGP